MSNQFLTSADVPVQAELLRLARLHAIAVLLADPDTIADSLESELYAYRDLLNGTSDSEPVA